MKDGTIELRIEKLTEAVLNCIAGQHRRECSVDRIEIGIILYFVSGRGLPHSWFTHTWP